MELAKKIQYFTLDVISSVGLGTAFGMLTSDRDVSDFIRSTEEGLYTASVFMALGLSWLTQVPWLGKFLAPSPKDPSGFGKMIATCFRKSPSPATDPRLLCFGMF